MNVMMVVSKEEMEMINAIRKQKQVEESIRRNKEYLEEIIASIIDAIGLDETRKIVREINRKLRDAE